MLKKFLAYYKPHKKMITLDMAASMLISLVGLIYPMVTRRMLGTLIPEKDYRGILIAGGIVLGLYLCRYFLQYFVQYYGHMIGVQMQAQMRRDLFSHLERMPFSFFDSHETGRIMSRLTSDLFDISELAHHGPENVLIGSVMLVGSFCYLCTINVPLTMIVFCSVPLLLAVAIRARREMHDAFAERRVTTAQINAAIESSVTGVRVTKAFTNAQKEEEKFERGNLAFVAACRKAYRAMARFHAGTSFITDLFNVIILIAGGLFLYAGKIDFAEYSAFVVSVSLFIGPINTLINFTENFHNGASGFERYVEIMELPEEEDEPGAEPLGRAEGRLELRDVSFRYETSDEVLRHVSLTVERGKTLALVGSSGGGKTTICHLIPGFYPLEGGEILLDGKNIRSITKESLRRNIGIVQQDVFLFGGTIRENILYGCPDAGEERMIEAAKNANIHDWVMTLKDGYDTEIGERGVKLSGGQKQRISIARVFLKDPAVLILDEATSALDNTTEIQIQRALDRLCVGRTTVVVAHRLSTIRRADEIAVIDGGEVAERGTHDELLARGGIYAELYALQFRE